MKQNLFSFRKIYQGLFFGFAAFISITLIIWPDPTITLGTIAFSRSVLLWILLLYVAFGELTFRILLRCRSCHRFLGSLVNPRFCSQCGEKITHQPSKRYFKDAKPRVRLYGGVFVSSMAFHALLVAGFEFSTGLVLGVTLLTLIIGIFVFLEVEHSYKRIRCYSCEDYLDPLAPNFCNFCGVSA